MLIVGDRRVKLMEDSMRASGESLGDYKFIVSSDGTMRTSFPVLQDEIKRMNISSLQKITVVCGVEDMIISDYTSEGKRIMLTCPNKTSYEQTVRLQKHAEMFERKAHDILDEGIQIIWVVPHPVDVETHLRLNLMDSQKDLTLEQSRHARFLTRMLNDTFQQWEGLLRKNLDRLVLPWFIKFVSVTSAGSKKFTEFMKAIRMDVRNNITSASIQLLLPEAIVDGFDPSHESIMRVMTALQRLFDKSSPSSAYKNKENCSHTFHSKESPIESKLISPALSLATQSCPPEVSSVEVDSVEKSEECAARNDFEINKIQ